MGDYGTQPVGRGATTARLTFLRRPLLLLLCLAGVGLLLVGGSGVVTGYRQHQRDDALRRWNTEATAASAAELPRLINALSAVPFPRDIRRASEAPARVNFVATFGPWRSGHSTSAVAREVVTALRRSSFTSVTKTPVTDGWRVTAATPDGVASLYIHQDDIGTAVTGLLQPDLPRCCEGFDR